MAPQTIFALNAKVTLKPGCKAGFLSVIRKDQAQTLAVEPGSVHFVVGEDTSDPNVLYLHEQYNSYADYKLHNETPHFAEFAAFIRKADPFVEDPVVHEYDLDTNNADKKNLESGFCIHTETFAKPEYREDFLELMRSYQAKIQADGKCLQFDWGVSTKDPNAIYAHEKYADINAYDAHRASKAFQAFRDFEETEPYSKPQALSYFNTIPGNPQDLVNATMVKERVWKRKRDDAEEQVIDLEDEPRHLIDFENKYTRIITIRMDPYDTTLAHRHARDTIIIILMKNGVDFINDVMGCSPAKGRMEFGQVGFAPYTNKPCVHKITNLSPEPFCVVNVEVLTKPPMSQAKPLVAPHHTLVKEQPNCRIYKVSLKPGECAPADYLFFYVRVVLEAGLVQETYKNILWKEELKMGDSEWKEPRAGGEIKNIGTTVYEAYICEFLQD